MNKMDLYYRQGQNLNITEALLFFLTRIDPFEAISVNSDQSLICKFDLDHQRLKKKTTAVSLLHTLKIITCIQSLGDTGKRNDVEPC